MNRPKLYQRIVTGALAVMMLLSSVTPTMSAFAAEAESVPASSIVVDTGDSVAVTEEYMEEQTPVDLPPAPSATPEPEATVTPSEELSAEPTPEPTDEVITEELPEATPKPSAEPTDTPEADATATPTIEPTVEPTAEPTPIPSEEPVPEETIEPTPTPSEEPTPEPSAEPTPEPTVEPAPEPEFRPLEIVEHSDMAQNLEVGTPVELYVKLNQDVKVSYQWQVCHTITDEIVVDVALYDYAEDVTTDYAFLIEGVTEAEHLAAYPDAAWPGMELYFAVVSALDVLGADHSNVSIQYGTPNLALQGYAIRAGYTEAGNVQLYADNGESHLIGKLNAEGKWQFGAAEPKSESVWQDIEGATEPVYTRTVTPEDATAIYRCKATILDEEYMTAALEFLAEQGVEVEEDVLETEQCIYSNSMQVAQPKDVAEAVENSGILPYLSGAAMLLAGDAQEVAISEDAQWITGVSAQHEYITAETYEKVQGWLAAGKISPEQADRYWTKIGSSAADKFEANVLKEDGLPTGETRLYRGFVLTNNNMLEVNSDWYGKTVYFRIVGSSGTGTAIKVPAYTTLDGAAGSTYKKAITILNPYVSDAKTVYLNFLASLNRNFTYADDTHIRIYSINCETFNKDPDQFLMDAEGTYRMDSVAWGVNISLEPDLSGKAYWALKRYLAEGYGLLIGHDTLYAYAGAYYDAYGVDFNEDDIDINDTSTPYYQLNSPLPKDGHWKMNHLMGSNAGNVYSNTVDPAKTPSGIISSGGSHGKFGKTLMFGNEYLKVLTNDYTPAQAAAVSKYRTPTNYPYAFNEGTVLQASLTHTNGQIAFGKIWVNYNGQSPEFSGIGCVAEEKLFEIGARTGTNNFYLSGNGNFLMNQIGHLPYNTAHVSEVELLVNSMLYVSQRKQCEICAANQAGQSDVHFVHRINSANAGEILTALQNGGSYWYSLNDCYLLTEDLDLTAWSGGWKAIRNFSGHWDSDIYAVALPAGQSLLQQSGSSWNLGTDRKLGVQTVFDASGNRTTGVARVVGDLNELFNTNTSYAGYTVKILGSDNPNYLSSSEVYSCTVNTDHKYIISNLPCIYDKASGTGILRARVYDTIGREVTEYGIIRVNVDQNFWYNDMTTKLYLGGFSVEAVTDVTTVEGAPARFVAQAISDDNLTVVGWQYREGSDYAWKDVPAAMGSWATIADTMTVDGDHLLSSQLTISQADPNWSGYQYRCVFRSALHGSFSTVDYWLKGGEASLTNNGGRYYPVYTKGSAGLLTVDKWPAKVHQSLDKTVYEGTNAAFTAATTVLDADGKVTVQWQYSTTEFNTATGEDEIVWHNMTDGTAFPSDSYSVAASTITNVTGSTNKMTGYPVIETVFEAYGDAADLAAFEASNKFYRVSSTMTVKNVDLQQDGTQFRAIFTAESKYGTTYSVASNAADDTNGVWVGGSDRLMTGAFAAFEASEGRSNTLYVLPPELRIEMLPAANQTNSATYEDKSTPDAYGQSMIVSNTTTNIADGTAYYYADVYYLPDQVKPSVSWQYRTFLSSVGKAWNTAAAKALGYSSVTVTVSNTDTGTKTVDGVTYNVIRSEMKMTGIPLAMYNSAEMLKYYFRCVAVSDYTTAYGSKSLTRVDTEWGGLVVDYAIYIHHNGVTEDGINNIQTAEKTTEGVDSIAGIESATKTTGGYAVWSYPNLSIRIPDDRRINTVMVYFDTDDGFDARNSIQYTASVLNTYGIDAKETVTDGSGRIHAVTFNAKNTDGVPTAKWVEFLRQYVSFKTYDAVAYNADGTATAGSRVRWYIDEENLADVSINPNTGSAYELVSLSSEISWADAKTAAQKYSDELGVTGKLVQIDNAAENDIVANLLNGKVGWIGANKTSSGWKWADGSAIAYNGWASGEPDASDAKYGNTGVIAGDTVLLNTASVSGYYLNSAGEHAVHNSVTNNGDKPCSMQRDKAVSDLYVLHNAASDPYHDYKLGTETYTGNILQRPLTVHSLYLDDPDEPRNVKEYDGTTDATITDILVDNIVDGDDVWINADEYAGSYKTANAGEKLDEDGKALPDRYLNLTENMITRSKDDEISLINNPFGDYYIAEEKYSGAIARAMLTAQVMGWSGMYGEGMSEVPWADKEYKAGQTSESWLRLDGLRGNDVLKLTDISGFAYDLLPDITTAVGVYPLDYEGMTDANYAVLKNYIVGVMDATLEVVPRKILVSADDVERVTRSTWKPLHASFAMQTDEEKYAELGSDSSVAYGSMQLIGSDTIGSVILVQSEDGTQKHLKMPTYLADGNIPFVTDCTVNTPALYLNSADAEHHECKFCEAYFGFEDGTDHATLAGYPVHVNQNPDAGDVLTVATVENFYGEKVQNYELVYEPGLIYVHPWARIQLEVTVPLNVCMYAYDDGHVIEPTNYAITNYSNG